MIRAKGFAGFLPELQDRGKSVEATSCNKHGARSHRGQGCSDIASESGFCQVQVWEHFWKVLGAQGSRLSCCCVCESIPVPAGAGMRRALNHSMILWFHGPPGEEDPCSSPAEGIGVAEFGAHQTQVRMSGPCLQFPRQHQSKKELLSSQKKLATLTGTSPVPENCSGQQFPPGFVPEKHCRGGRRTEMNFTMEFLQDRIPAPQKSLASLGRFVRG